MRTTSHIRRREALALLAGAALLPRSARAQPSERVRRVALVMALGANDALSPERVDTFVQTMKAAGWSERDLAIDWHWDATTLAQMTATLRAIAKQQPDVIVTQTSAMLSAAQKEAPGIPIVFTFVSDPVGIGAVASLARPGGHITGFTPFEPSLVNKWLELLKEIAPRVTHAALLFNRNNPGAQQLAQAATAKAGIVPVIRAVDDMPGIEAAAAEQARQPGGALVFIPDQFNSVHRKPIVALAARLKLPAIYPFRHFADDGGLIAYGTNSNDVFRQVGTYVDRILRGANPGDLPVQSPTKFDLAINMTAAKALGLTIPPTLLVSADAVIE